MTERKIVRTIIQSRLLPSKALGKLTLEVMEVRDMVQKAQSILDAEPAVLTFTQSIERHFSVIGDLHGNIDVLLRIFDQLGYPPKTSYIFLGDYVDRGTHSCEVLTLLYALKVLYPDNIFLLRGNHEFKQICTDFKKECTCKLGGQACEEIIQSFDKLPIAAIVGDNFLVHAGFSPSVTGLSDLTTMTKPLQDEFDITSSIADYLWSDPVADVEDFEENTQRGAGKFYGPSATSAFLRKCGLQRIIRGHEACMDGFDWPFGEDNRSVLTVFSSDDYCEMGNDAAAVTISSNSDMAEVTTFPPVFRMEKKRRIGFPSWMLTALPKPDNIAPLEIRDVHEAILA